MSKLSDAFLTQIKTLNIDHQKFIESLTSNVPTSIRINPSKLSVNNPSGKIGWTEYGYYLENRPHFIYDPLIHMGSYYVQEASSMMLEQIMNEIKIDSESNVHTYLDLCAAPGGKSTHLLSMIDENDMLIANETIGLRASILSENIIKWGKSNVIVTRNDSVDFKNLPEHFDVILADVPCSGEGMFRKDSNAISEWSLNNVQLCSERQRKIITNIWDSLKPGGYLIYSTCTFNKKENEENIAYFKSIYDFESVRIPLNTEWGVSEIIEDDIFVYKCFPHLVKGEGFTFSVLRKDGELPENKQKRRNKQTRSGIQFICEKNNLHYSHLLDKENFCCFTNDNENIWAIQKCFKDDVLMYSNYLSIVSAGTPLVEVKGHKLNPLPGFAFSEHLNVDFLPTVNVEIIEALTYLRKEPLHLHNTPKGWILLKYKNFPLGFVKNLGDRANNPYPINWRIRNEVPADIAEIEKMSVSTQLEINL